VIAEGGEAGKDEAALPQIWRGLISIRPFCRHALTNIRNRVMMPR
jgi:hypothetical protein